MSRYRRAQVPGATYFFTVNLKKWGLKKMGTDLFSSFAWSPPHFRQPWRQGFALRDVRAG